MANLLRDAASKGVTEKSLLIQVPYCGKGGIRSTGLVRNRCASGKLNLICMQITAGRGEQDHRWSPKRAVQASMAGKWPGSTK